MLELVACPAAEVGVVLVGIDGGAGGSLDLAHAGMVVDEFGRALGGARRAWRLRSLVGAGQPVLLVVKVLALVAGAGSERPDLVALASLVMVKGPIAVGPCGCAAPGAGYV